MDTSKLQYQPLVGKTFSLFGATDSTSGYFRNIGFLADEVLKIEDDMRTVIPAIQQFSEQREYLKKILNENHPSGLISELLALITPALNPYTRNVDDHLKHLHITKYRDRRLRTTREQYHLYMLEIELTNRLCKKNFLDSGRKIALLPYCLRDLTVKCKSAPAGLDYRCGHCSPKCYQNHVSKLLSNNHIEPYIWMGRSMKKLAKRIMKNGTSFGVLGIACIPELAWGMRKCMKFNIPVVGLPLNANRCRRWWGKFFPNSVDLEELQKLIVK